MIYIWLAIAVALMVLVLFLFKGRRNHPKLTELRKWSYAHRGLHNAELPENSMAAFRAAVEAGYGIELDIHLMKDGKLAIIHDASLKRTAGVDVKIEDLCAEDLENYRLEGTEEKIPLFTSFLEMVDGKVPLVVELKCERSNYNALCTAACEILDGYHGLYCVESFDPRCIRWLRKKRPEFVRGQLSQRYSRKDRAIPGILRFVLRNNLLNCLTNPDFVAYRFSERKNLGNLICRKLWGVQGVTWTIRSEEDYNSALVEDWIPIFENFKPEKQTH